MSVGTGSHAERMRINRRDIALKRRVFAGVTDRKHCIKDQFLISFGFFFTSLPKCCTDKFCFRRVEVLSQRSDQIGQVFFVHTGVPGVVPIFVALPPKEASDLVLGCLWVKLTKLLKHILCSRDVAVILKTSLPPDRFWLRSLFPFIRTLAITSKHESLFLHFFRFAILHFHFKLVRFTSRGKQVPTKAAITNCGFKDQYWFIQSVAELMSNARFNSDLATGDGQPIVAFNT